MSSVSNLHSLARLVQPSFTSGAMAVTISLGVVLLLLSPSLYKGSEFALYFDLLLNQRNSLQDDYQLVSTAVNSSEFAADVSVFVVWMIIGLLAYTIVHSIFRLVMSFVRFVRDVEYFKADREKLALEALTHLGIRVAAAALLFGFYKLLFPYIVSYIFVFAHAALTGSWLMGVWYVLIMAVIVAAAVHVIVVLLRLVLLRVRVFFDRYSLDEA